MKELCRVSLDDVKEVYNGVEGDLWELVMGEQIHIGGVVASKDLAEKAAIQAGTKGVDFCCCNGAGMRFLKRFVGVESMVGVDASEKVIASGIERCKKEGNYDSFEFVLEDVCKNGLESEAFDFVWGQDAWCYVTDKEKLIEEAVRVVKPGGTIAFSDWMEGESGLSDEEGERFLSFMKFPNVLKLAEYSALLEKYGCEISFSADTELFYDYTCLYLEMLGKQLTYDALKIIGFDSEVFDQIAGEMVFLRDLAKDSKIIQGQIIARKRD